MDPPEIKAEIEAMSEYQAKLVLSLMAGFNMSYDEAKERAKKLYDRVFEWEGEDGKGGYKGSRPGSD